MSFISRDLNLIACYYDILANCRKIDPILDIKDVTSIFKKIYNFYFYFHCRISRLNLNVRRSE